MIKVNTKNNLIWGVSFTPDFYKRMYTNFLLGMYRDVYALIARAEIDGYISGCLVARHSGYKRKFTLTPASDSKSDKKISDFVEGVFSNLSMRSLFEAIVDAKLKQYSVVSLDWEVRDGQQIISNFDYLEPKYFRIDPADNQIKIDWGSTMEPIDEQSAFIVRYKKPMIMLTVLKCYIRKEFGEESWSSFLEVFGEPFIFGTYPPGMQDREKEALEAGVENLGMSGRGIGPKGSEISITESHRNTGDHHLYKEDIKTEIALALLGHENAAGTKKEGMQVGQNLDAFRVTQHIAIDDMCYIEEQINPLIRMLVDRNFPNVKTYPKLIFDKSDAADPKDKLTALQIIIGAGGKVDPSIASDFGITLVDQVEPLQQQPLLPGLRQAP